MQRQILIIEFLHERYAEEYRGISRPLINSLVPIKEPVIFLKSLDIRNDKGIQRYSCTAFQCIPVHDIC